MKVGTVTSQALDSHGPPVWALDARGPPVWALDACGPPVWALVPPLHTAWGIWLMCAHKPNSQGITLPRGSLKKPPSHHPRPPPAVAAVAVAAFLSPFCSWSFSLPGQVPPPPPLLLLLLLLLEGADHHCVSINPTGKAPALVLEAPEEVLQVPAAVSPAFHFPFFISKRGKNFFFFTQKHLSWSVTWRRC